MERLFHSVVVGVTVAIVVWFGFGLYTWTAIHSGWSKTGMHVFLTASWVVPIILGVLAGRWSWRGRP